MYPSPPSAAIHSSIPPTARSAANALSTGVRSRSLRLSSSPPVPVSALPNNRTTPNKKCDSARLRTSTLASVALCNGTSTNTTCSPLDLPPATRRTFAYSLAIPKHRARCPVDPAAECTRVIFNTGAIARTPFGFTRLSEGPGGRRRKPIVPSSVSSAVGNACVPILFLRRWMKIPLCGWMGRVDELGVKRDMSTCGRGTRNRPRPGVGLEDVGESWASARASWPSVAEENHFTPDRMYAAPFSSSFDT